MNHPFFSIIIPVYNVERYLEQCVNSILRQSFNDFEIILINDGSTDSSQVLAEKILILNAKVILLNQHNQGLSVARNVGIQNSNGKYLLFLDSDDFYNDNDFLDTLYQTACKKPEVIVINFGWVKYFPSSGQYVKDRRNFSIELLETASDIENIILLLENDLYIACAWNKCVRRNFIIENQIFFEKGLRSEDMDWCGKILFLSPKMTCVNMNSYVYRQQRIESITSNVDLSHISDIVQMIFSAVDNSKHLKSNKRYQYLSFFAVQYLTLLFNIKVSKTNIPSDLLLDVFRLRFILNNDLNYKVKFIRKLLNIFGYRITTSMLKMYVLITNR